jgi:hypothetical protein
VATTVEINYSVEYIRADLEAESPRSLSRRGALCAARETPLPCGVHGAVQHVLGAVRDAPSVEAKQHEKTIWFVLKSRAMYARRADHFALTD